jgi:radical SAM superfamily enzyme YgiQ (UPF0313 family)
VASIETEAARLTASGPLALSDVGAATANLWGAECRAPGRDCRRSSCLYPDICPNLDADQGRWLGLLKRIAALPGLKQVRVASGLRFDLALTDEKVLAEFLGRFVGGQLKVAPEHLDSALLRLMRKPGPEVFEKFLRVFQKHAPAGQYLVPYLISAFPGSDKAAMDRLAGWFRRRFWRPR